MTQDCQCLFPGSPALWVLNKLSDPAPPVSLPAPRVLLCRVWAASCCPAEAPCWAPSSLHRSLPLGRASGCSLSPGWNPYPSLCLLLVLVLRPPSSRHRGGCARTRVGGWPGVRARESLSRCQPPRGLEHEPGTRAGVICHSSALRLFLHIPSWGLSLGWSGGWE